ncbi:zinc finger protein ZFPM1-like [Dipodomys merriami]|uniref:zinc finger protein ZFPM1-like n=1 Tax=Dipodomys merriami TaxID=94247 RepID=UPI00385570C2
MSRRKQSNPRQIKRSLGDMEAAEEAQAAGSGPTEPEATAPEPKTAKEDEPPSPCRAEMSPPRGAAPPTPPGGSEETEGQEPDRRPQEQEEEEEAAAASPWSGPEDLELELRDGRRCVRARLSLAEGLSWGPFQGTIQTRAASPGQTEEGPALPLKLTDEGHWLRTLPQALTEAEANSEIYRKDGALWCRVTKPVPAGGRLHVALMAEPLGTPSQPAKEPAEPERPAPGHADIQLLPQQAGMASILATAVINKDIFPCKDCGIWYRSERNLQAHLLYYCASRQRAASPAAAASEEKPKETYPNERICPFPQCRKSCPSASSLEIHMRSHSGERPFVCLICLSAFTTKANCERHLKVHTDTLSGVCHNCGFISTTRDILYSHLVTSHMVCQPGSKGEIYSPGAKLPADGLAGFQQPSALQGPLVSATTPSPGPDRKAPAAATNGEAPAAPQNGGGSEPPAAPRSVKVEAAEEPEASPGEAGPRAPRRTPSPASPPAVRVKAELPSPTPGSSPGPGELRPAGALLVPPLVCAPEAGAAAAAAGPAAPQASEILAKMSELVHSRLQQGPAGAAAGATCFECEITFHHASNFYVHKRLYCSGRRAPGPDPPPRDAAAAPAAAPAAAGEGGRSPGGSGDDAEDDPSRTLCEACNIRFSRHETYTVHKRYYCASRHDPPPRRPPAPAAPGAAAPAAAAAAPPAPPAPPARTRRRRKLYELPAAGAPPPAAGHAPPGAGHAPAAAGHAPAPEPPGSPRPPSGSGSAGSAAALSPDPAPDGPIDLSKRPRRRPPEPPAALPGLADYHECTACRVSFHSLEAYLAHKQFSCPAAPLRAAAPCPYCPPNGRARADLVEHLRLAHGLRGARPAAAAAAAPGAEPAAERAPRDSPDGRAPRSPSPDPADPGARAPGGGHHRYCRLCNIRFSSLSTFIAHKKYYCSSHAAEHVK